VPPGLRFENLPPIHAVLIARPLRTTWTSPPSRGWRASTGRRSSCRSGFGRGSSRSASARSSSWTGGSRRDRRPRGDGGARAALVGRSLLLADQNERLWASWGGRRAGVAGLFFGRHGLSRGFAQIGRRFAAFDLAALPIGGYSDFRHHHPNHLSPEETVLAFEDLRATLLVPMHGAPSTEP